MVAGTDRHGRPTKSTLASSALTLVALACGPSRGSNGGTPLEGKWGFPVRSATAQRLSQKTIAVLLSASAASTCDSDPGFFETSQKAIRTLPRSRRPSTEESPVSRPMQASPAELTSCWVASKPQAPSRARSLGPSKRPGAPTAAEAVHRNQLRWPSTGSCKRRRHHLAPRVRRAP